MKMRVVLVGAVVVLAMPATASAGEPAAGCPTGKELLSIEATLNLVDDRIYSPGDWPFVVEAVGGVDANGDGLLCIKQYKPNKGQDKHWGATDYIISQISDNNSVGRTPS